VEQTNIQGDIVLEYSRHVPRRVVLRFARPAPQCEWRLGRGEVARQKQKQKQLSYYRQTRMFSQPCTLQQQLQGSDKEQPPSCQRAASGKTKELGLDCRALAFEEEKARSAWNRNLQHSFHLEKKKTSDANEHVRH